MTMNLDLENGISLTTDDEDLVHNLKRLAGQCKISNHEALSLAASFGADVIFQAQDGPAVRVYTFENRPFGPYKITVEKTK